jgi:DNA-binding transcriptional LysR family regulator
MSRTLSIDFLRTFVAIADAGTFAAAAERVGRTVSAVSLQIDRLEEQVGRAVPEVRTTDGADLGRQAAS